MAKEDPKKGKEGDAFSDGAEIFEDIFKEATESIKKPQQGSQPAGGRGQGTASRKPPGGARKPVPPKPQAHGKARPASPPQTITEIETGNKPKRPVSIAKIGILTLLLLILGGAVLNYLGVVDVTAIIDMFGLGKKEVVQAPPPRRPPPKAPAKAPTQPGQKQGGEKVAASPEPSTPAPSAVPPKKEPPPAVAKQEPVKVEPPAPVAQKQPEQEPGRQEPPAAAQHVQPRVEPPQPQASHEAPTPVAAPPEPKPASPPAPPPAPAVAQAQPQPKPVPVQPAPQPAPPSQPKPKAEPPAQQVRPPAPAEGTLPQGSLNYPYSVYLGSYQSVETAKKITSQYEHEELTAYWARVHLGEKGTWYRVFAGYFRSEAEAAGFIARKQIKDAEVKRTKYAVLIGVYGSREEAKKRSGELFNLGFSAYVVPEAGSKFRLYTGAYHTKDGADINAAELASKGIRSQAMER
jgi:hypothetical protein